MLSNGKSLNLAASHVCAILVRGPRTAIKTRIANHYARLANIEFAIDDHASTENLGAKALDPKSF
jgi:ATP-dependent protease Clp ATPase subunit